MLRGLAYFPLFLPFACCVCGLPPRPPWAGWFVHCVAAAHCFSPSHIHDQRWASAPTLCLSSRLRHLTVRRPRHGSSFHARGAALVCSDLVSCVLRTSGPLLTRWWACGAFFRFVGVWVITVRVWVLCVCCFRLCLGLVVFPFCRSHCLLRSLLLSLRFPFVCAYPDRP